MSDEAKPKHTPTSHWNRHRQQQKLPPNFDFYADFVVVPSTQEEEKVGPFVDQIREILKDFAPQEVVITHCSDAKFYKGEYLERSSVVLYFFTKLSKEKYSSYTCKPGFQDFLYEERFIPVLGEKDVILPLNAKIATPLIYLKSSKVDIRSMMLKLYEKYKHIRKERQNSHSKKENLWLSHSSHVPEKNYQGMHIIAKNLMIGDNNTMIAPTPVENNDSDKEDMNDEPKSHLSQNNSLTSVYYKETGENGVFRRRGTQFPSGSHLSGVDQSKNSQIGHEYQGRHGFITLNEEDTQEKEAFSDETFEKQVHQSSLDGNLNTEPPATPVSHRTPFGLRGSFSSPSNAMNHNYQHKKPVNDKDKEWNIKEKMAEYKCKKNIIPKQIPDKISGTNNLSNTANNVFKLNFPPNIPIQSHSESNNIGSFTANGRNYNGNEHFNVCRSPTATTASPQSIYSSSSNQDHSPLSLSNDHRSCEKISLPSSPKMHRGYEGPSPMAIALSSFQSSSFSDIHISSNTAASNQNKTVSWVHLKKDILTCIPKPFSDNGSCGNIEGDKEEIVNDLKKK